ncbi:hypothetical protein B0T14DRAFT_435937 [Immersiella caudata]|uniref:Mechanosensitive ion channel protein Msy1/2-like transmembrane domain-containing protein n=1 Tax=Immersiella caudata TaxID=314043 RepID=A0AA40BWU6_9PEZI|nr:hypothetical protein B0T14DRAFT_435937 [Immersiella caudata]
MEKNYSKIQGSEVFGAPPDGSSDNIPPKAAQSHSTASASWFSHNGRFILWFVKFVVVWAVVSVLLAIPVAIYRDIENFPEEATPEELKERLRPLYIYNVFTFLLVSWVSIAFFYLLGTTLPYIFRFIARYVNPAHTRYWRIVRVMRKPLCFVGSLFVSFLAFDYCVAFNGLITIAAGIEGYPWQSHVAIEFISDFLEQCSLWALFYFFEKIIILYTTIHYHFRSDLGRIWMSMVPMGKDCLKASDIAEVLGPFRKEEAEKYFKTLDQNEMGDIRLDEMEWTVTEAGKVRNAIYRGMQNADHCINTLDWILLLFIAVIMVFFIMVEWVPNLKAVQDTLKFFSLGVAFAIGRSVHHFLAGVVFILFDHPYDIGDRIELWSGQSNQSVNLFVERQSLLYTVFRRADNWMELQVGNEFLQQCRIENVTRSGSNRQAVTMMVDIRTSFKDLTLLKNELEAFMKHPDNKRDFLPNVALAITAVHELNKLELRLVITHRTNWSIEPLRAARCMKVMTAVVAAVRKIRILRPDAGPLGQPGRPLFNVMLTEKEANERMERLREEATSARVDAGVGDNPPEAIIDVTNIQRGEDIGPEGDLDKVRMAMEEAAFMRRSEREVRAEEEKKAMAALGKLPPLPHKGPPVRQEGALCTGAETTTGKRATLQFRG